MKKFSTAHTLLVDIAIVQLALTYVIAQLGKGLPMVASLLISQLSILLPFIVYCIIKKQNPLELIRFKKIRISTAVLSVLIALCSYPVVVFLNLVSMLFVENAMLNVMPQVLSMGLLAGILLMAVLPAIVEETIFRGVLYNTYSKRRPIAAIFLSALLFGLMHMNFNQMPYAIYLGIIMALLMEACDSILAPMILHFTLNGTSTLLSFLTMGTMENTAASGSTDIKSALMESYQLSAAQMGMEITEEQLSAMMPVMMVMMIGIYAIIAIVALVIVLALIYAVFCANNRKPAVIFKADHSDTAYVECKNGKIRKNRMIDLPVILFIIYALVVCVLNAVS